MSLNAEYRNTNTVIVGSPSEVIAKLLEFADPSEVGEFYATHGVSPL